MTVRVTTGDGLQTLRSLPDASVAAVVTDPPWNRGKRYGDGIDDRQAAGDYRSWLDEVVREALRVAADAVVLLVGDEHVAGLARGVASWERVLRWRPPPTSVRPPTTLDLRDEPVVVWRSHPPHQEPPPVLRAPLVADPYLAVHPCPKPVGLFSALIDGLVEEPGAVLDPFCGVGSCLVAARRAGRAAHGVELDPHTAAVAARRLQAAT